MSSMLTGSDVEAEEYPNLTEAENNRTMKRLVLEWSLGPDRASSRPGDNAEFWREVAEIWDITEAQARRWLCANCEYFDNSPAALEAMEAVPFNRFDADGGGRGYCHKFKFICHNLRTCQAWDERECEAED
jgi:hypothetical protein